MSPTYRVWNKTDLLCILCLVSNCSKCNRELCTNKLDVGYLIAKCLEYYKIFWDIENVIQLMHCYGCGVCTATVVSVLQFSVAQCTAVSH
jgi:hypothetical protein